MRRIFEHRIFKSRVKVTRLIIAILSVASLGLGIAARIIPQHGTSAAPSTPAPIAMYTLITGERIMVTRAPGGTPTVSVLPDGGGSGGGGGGGGFCDTPHGLQTFASGQHLYVVPDDAAGYIGAPLSIDLFDVNAMAPDTSATATSQPQVSVEYTAGTSSSAQHLPPGLSKAANGSITVTDRKQFGAALAQSWRTNASGGASRMFDGIARIAPAGATAGNAAPTPPPGKLFTVTFRAFDRQGLPAVDAFVMLENVDDSAMYFSMQGVYRGDAAFSVPAGHYQYRVDVHMHHPDNSYDVADTIVPEIDVTHDTTIVVEAKKAQLVSVTTPLPTSPYGQAMTLERADAQGHTFTDDLFELCGVPLYETPSTTSVTVGKVWYSSEDLLTNPQDALDSYTYDLYFPYGTTIPSTLAETVTAGQLATLQARYHSPVPGRLESVGRAPVSPGQLWGGTLAFMTPVVPPAERTEYVTAQPNVFWQQMIEVNGASEADSEYMYSDLASYTPGQQMQDDLMAQPLASGIQQETIQDPSQNPALGQVCPLCRGGDTLTTWLYPFTDEQSYISSSGPATTENLTLYQNGTQVGQLPYAYGASFAMSPDPATYKLVYDVSNDDPTWPTSTRVHTEWTFASRERAADQLPAGWTCGDSYFNPGTNSAGCSFEPLLFASYNTPGVGLDNVIPAGGPATVDVTLRHQRGAAATAISHFTAQVSYDDGQAWQNASATDQGNGVYRLQYTQPALEKTNGFAALHIQAADSNGNAIDQTITRAYQLAVMPATPLPTQPGASSPLACATPTAAPYAQCMAVVNIPAAGGGGGDGGSGQPSGLSPADIQAAYHLSPAAGQGRTVAIVDAYDDPNAEADLAAYRAHYGLPACTSANGCFAKVNQRGETANLPWPNPGWAVEISLDLDAVSATCPGCHILLVEADSSSVFDLLTAVQTAQRRGANVISNSYGSPEFSGERSLERYYRDLSVPFVVASGDYGYGNTAPMGAVAYPAASEYAIAVGGTKLTRADNSRGWSESAWGASNLWAYGATSGCSAYIHKPGWQKDNLCGMRTVADVSAVADPATGLAVYDTFFLNGWLQVGGTSLSAPIVSAVIAMAGDGSTLRYASSLYDHTADLNDVTSGNNGTTCSGTYLCTAVPGYDGPTGLGTPNGTNAFH